MIKVLSDRVLVKVIEEDETTESGIIISALEKEKPMTAEVVSVGEGYRDDNGGLVSLSVKEGDKVLFSKYAGSEVKLGDLSYLIMREEDIFGVFSENK